MALMQSSRRLNCRSKGPAIRESKEKTTEAMPPPSSKDYELEADAKAKLKLAHRES
jgi:hypothetical protein